MTRGGFFLLPAWPSLTQLANGDSTVDAVAPNQMPVKGPLRRRWNLVSTGHLTEPSALPKMSFVARFFHLTKILKKRSHKFVGHGPTSCSPRRLPSFLDAELGCAARPQ